MSFFSVLKPLLPSIASAATGSLVSGFFGSRAADKQREQAVQLLSGTSQSPFGSIVRSTSGDIRATLSPELQAEFDRNLALADAAGKRFSAFDRPAAEARARARLSRKIEPQMEEAEATLRNQLYQRGRLGVGTGTGANPEMKALLEAQNEARLAQVEASEDIARAEQQQEFSDYLGHLNVASGLQTGLVGGTTMPGFSSLEGIASAGTFEAAFANQMGAFFGEMSKFLGEKGASDSGGLLNDTAFQNVSNKIRMATKYRHGLLDDERQRRAMSGPGYQTYGLGSSIFPY